MWGPAAVDIPIGGREAGYAAGVSRAVWWVSAAAALAFTVWVGTSWSMAEVSLSCAKIGESLSSYRCDDRVVHALGIRPVVGSGLLLTTPPVVAALVMRKWVSWLVVAQLACLSIAGLANCDSYWGSLMFAVPLATVGAVAASFQRTASGSEAPRNGSAATA